MCGGGSKPEDKSDKVAEIEAADRREVRAAEERKQKQERERFNQGLSSAYQGAIGNARNFFQSQGLNPDQYLASITGEANASRAMVPQGSDSFASFFDNLGQRVFDRETEGARAKAQREISRFTGPGFYRELIGDNALDKSRQAVLEEERARAQQYADNLRNRGIFTDRGFNAATSDLDSQKSRANRQLAEIAMAMLESGRGDLRDIATRGTSAAREINLGDSFDPLAFQRQINDKTRNFFATLGENFRSFVPQDLFDTSNLSLVGGRAQGAQNTPFDPKALAGILGEDDEDEEETTAML